MAEMILGIGRQDSIRNIISILDESLRRVRGVPRKVMGHGDNVEVEAERSDYDKDFDTFTVRITTSGALGDKLAEAASGLGDACEHTVEDGVHTFVCPGPNSQDAEAARKAVDLLSKQFTLPEVWRFDGAKYRTDPISTEMLFKALLKYGASDIHLAPGKKPIFRVDNQTRSADIIGTLSAAQILELIRAVAPSEHWEEFEKEKQTSFSFHQKGLGYARASAFLKSGAPHFTFRYQPEKVPNFEELMVPPEMMKDLAKLHNGLLLVVGMTGSGKTTTAAALIGWINRTRACHILTIENPVEYVHENRKAFVSQRTLGDDVLSFEAGVVGALRHDPDVILIGEMRDADTIRAAISAASTGHLVVSTLHSNNASGVVNRIVSFFDPVERDLVRTQLQENLRCVIAQKLLPKKGGGRLPALEIMYNDIKVISDAIINGDVMNLRIGMQQGLSHSTMFEQYIYKMYKDDLITLDIAKEYAPEISMFEQILMGTYTIPRPV